MTVTKRRNNPGNQSRRNRQPSNVRSFPRREERGRVQRMEPKQQRPASSAQQRKTNRRRKSNGREQWWILVIISVFIVLYLAGQGIRLLTRSDIRVETVGYGSIDVPKKETGLIVRDEAVFTADRAGQTTYYFSEGDRIQKDAVICEIREAGTADLLESKIESLDRDILKNQASRSDLSAYSEDIARIEDNMTVAVDSYAGKSMSADTSYLYSLKTKLQSEIGSRNEIWLAENVEGLSSLSEEKKIYEQQLSQSMSTLRTPQSGVLALSTDGLESTFTPENMSEITEKQIGTGSTSTSIIKSGNVEVGAPLFRLIYSNNWYVVAYLPAAETEGWEESDLKTLCTEVDQQTIELSARIYSIEAAEDKSRVVFSISSNLTDFMDQRTLTFYVESEEVTGLKVPNDAIVEKSLIRIPNEYVTESLGNTGVLVKNGDNVTFTEITVARSDETNVYIMQDNGTVPLGATLQKTGEDAETYTLSELVPFTGVYVANSSVARFVQVEILESNQEYSIVKAGSGANSLQPYDVIVQDARNVSEGQEIY